jgi:predicted transcriptional regulator
MAIRLSPELKQKIEELADVCLPEKSAATRRKAVKLISKKTREFIESLPKARN